MEEEKKRVEPVARETRKSDKKKKCKQRDVAHATASTLLSASVTRDFAGQVKTAGHPFMASKAPPPPPARAAMPAMASAPHHHAKERRSKKLVLKKDDVCALCPAGPHATRVREILSEGVVGVIGTMHTAHWVSKGRAALSGVACPRGCSYPSSGGVGRIATPPS